MSVFVKLNILFSFNFVLSLPLLTEGGCKEGEFLYGAYCYKINNFELAWDEAEAHCQIFGGHLASVTSEEENSALLAQLDYHIPIPFFWLGASKGINIESFVWNDGQPFNFTNWDVGEPDLYPTLMENICTTYKLNTLPGKYIWQDESCISSLGAFICKRNATTLCIHNGIWSSTIDGCYALVDIEASWNEAAEICSSNTAALAKPFQSLPMFEQTIKASLKDYDGKVWIGLKKISNDYITIDDEHPNFSLLPILGEQYISEGECIAVLNGRLYGENCGMEIPFLCQELPVEEVCLTGLHFGESCYKVIDENVGFYDAINICSTIMTEDTVSHLAEISSIEVQRYLGAELTVNNNMKYWFAAFANPPTKTYIWFDSGRLVPSYVLKNTIFNVRFAGLSVSTNYPCLLEPSDLYTFAFPLCEHLMVLKHLPLIDLEAHPEPFTDPTDLTLQDVSEELFPTEKIELNTSSLQTQDKATEKMNITENIELSSLELTGELAFLPKINQTNKSLYACTIFEYEFKNHCYGFVDHPLKWQEARDICEGHGYHLTTINSEKEQEFLTPIVSNFGEFWVGGIVNNSSEWMWVTDEDFSTYTNWDEHENHNIKQKECMFMSMSGKWYSMLCNYTRKYSCERVAGLVNVAFNKEAASSSTYNSESTAKLAVDGNRGEIMSEGNCFISKDESDPWWKVDLSQIYIIYRVIVSNQKELLGQSFKVQTFEILLDQEFSPISECKYSNTSYEDKARNNTEVFDCWSLSRFVKIVKRKYINSYLLTLCEVEILTTALGSVNVALGKETSMSSSYHNSDASLGVDGNTDSYFLSGTCFHTSVDEDIKWWKVNLGQIYTIEKVIITNRFDCCSEQLFGTEVWVGKNENSTLNEQCGNTIDEETAVLETIQEDCNSMNGGIVGEFVELKNPSPYALHACEIQVMVLEPLDICTKWTILDCNSSDSVIEQTGKWSSAYKTTSQPPFQFTTLQPETPQKSNYYSSQQDPGQLKEDTTSSSISKDLLDSVIEQTGKWSSAYKTTSPPPLWFTTLQPETPQKSNYYSSQQDPDQLKEKTTLNYQDSGQLEEKSTLINQDPGQLVKEKTTLSYQNPDQLKEKTTSSSISKELSESSITNLLTSQSPGISITKFLTSNSRAVTNFTPSEKFINNNPTTVYAKNLEDIVKTFKYETELVAQIKAGSQIEIYNFWKNPNALKNVFKRSSEIELMENSVNILTNWETSSIRKVYLILYEKEQEVMLLAFNGTGSSRINWFSEERLLYSTYDDMKSKTKDYFSLKGQYEPEPNTKERRFFISKSSDSCSSARGWLIVVERRGSCHWENHTEPPPYLIYSPLNSNALWETEGRKADKLEIYGEFYQDSISTMLPTEETFSADSGNIFQNILKGKFRLIEILVVSATGLFVIFILLLICCCIRKRCHKNEVQPQVILVQSRPVYIPAPMEAPKNQKSKRARKVRTITHSVQVTTVSEDVEGNSIDNLVDESDSTNTEWPWSEEAIKKKDNWVPPGMENEFLNKWVQRRERKLKKPSKWTSREVKKLLNPDSKHKSKNLMEEKSRSRKTEKIAMTEF